MSMYLAFQASSSPLRLHPRRQRFVGNKSVPKCTIADTNQSPSEHPSIVFLMRHGMTDWNLLKRVQGSLDESRLNTTGIKQAQSAGVFLRNIPFDQVYCSPLTRARHTAHLLARASSNPTLINSAPVVLDSFKEMTFPWQGSFRDVLSSGEWAEHYKLFRTNPRTFTYNGFSPLLDMEKRAQTVLQTISDQNPRHVLLIGHNQANKALISAALDMPAELDSWIQGNCCVNIFEVSPHRPPVLRLCNGILSTTTLKVMRRRAFRYPRPGHVRVVLVATHSLNSPHIKEHFASNQVKYVYALQTIGVSHRIIDTHNLDVQFKLLPVPPESGNRSLMYNAAVRFLNFARTKHIHGCVAIVAQTPSQVATFFAAFLQIGVERSSRFHCDMDSISAVDITACNQTTIPVTRRVLYFNVPPIMGDTLLQYASCVSVAQDCAE